MKRYGERNVEDVQTCRHKAEVGAVRFEISSCTVCTAKSRVDYLFKKRKVNISWLSFSTWCNGMQFVFYSHLQPNASKDNSSKN